MSLWQYLYGGGVPPWVLIVILVVIIVVLILFLFIYCRPILKLWKLAKSDHDFATLKKLIQKEIKRKHCKIAFAAVNGAEYSPSYEKIKNIFVSEEDIIPIDSDCDTEQLQKSFAQYRIVVYKVPPDEFKGSPNPENKTSTYKKIAEYCSQREKHCVLMTDKGYIEIDELDSEYVTTVNYYSKLRETLYILLYFSAINFE